MHSVRRKHTPSSRLLRLLRQAIAALKALADTPSLLQQLQELVLVVEYSSATDGDDLAHHCSSRIHNLYQDYFQARAALRCCNTGFTTFVMTKIVVVLTDAITTRKQFPTTCNFHLMKTNCPDNRDCSDQEVFLSAAHKVPVAAKEYNPRKFRCRTHCCSNPVCCYQMCCYSHHIGAHSCP